MIRDSEIEIVFRRLDQQIIDRAMARVAIKFLARASLDDSAWGSLASQVDAIFDEHETTAKHPLLLAFRIKRLFDDYFQATEQTAPERQSVKQ